MRFLFVNLDWPGLVSKKTYKIHLSFPPLDLILMSNFAQDGGHEAKIFDCFVQNPDDGLAQQIHWADWVIVATTPYHMWQCPNSEWEWIKLSLERFPSSKMILSGLHASVFPEQTLRETSAHAVICREPETVFREFLEKERWSECSGVARIEDGELKVNSHSRLASMDELVIKDYSVDIANYGYLLLGRRTGIFEASRGCPWKCTFCDQEMYSWKYRTKSPEIFAQEVSRSIKQTGMQTAYFFDLEFTVEKRRTISLCQELIAAGIPTKIKWCCQTRADMVDEEILDALKDAGCKLIHFGVESANPHVLKQTNKKTSVQKIETGVRLAKRKGFQTACFFMFGLPGEEPEEFDNTLEFARALNPTYGSFHFAIPFPGTPLYEQYLREKGLSKGVWPATYFDKWQHEMIASYIRCAYVKFFLCPKRFELREFLFRMENLPFKLKYFMSLR